MRKGDNERRKRAGERRTKREKGKKREKAGS